MPVLVGSPDLLRPGPRGGETKGTTKEKGILQRGSRKEQGMVRLPSTTGKEQDLVTLLFERTTGASRVLDDRKGGRGQGGRPREGPNAYRHPSVMLLSLRPFSHLFLLSEGRCRDML